MPRSVHRTSAGTVSYQRCVCGSWLVRERTVVVAATLSNAAVGCDLHSEQLDEVRDGSLRTSDDAAVGLPVAGAEKTTVSRVDPGQGDGVTGEHVVGR
jgi:hypothetical protein